MAGTGARSGEETVLQPDDVVIHGGYEVEGREAKDVWIPGRRMITDLAMSPDAVKITVSKDGQLSINATDRKMNFVSPAGRWQRVEK